MITTDLSENFSINQSLLHKVRYWLVRWLVGRDAFVAINCEITIAPATQGEAMTVTSPCSGFVVESCTFDVSMPNNLAIRISPKRPKLRVVK